MAYHAPETLEAAFDAMARDGARPLQEGPTGFLARATGSPGERCWTSRGCRGSGASRGRPDGWRIGAATRWSDIVRADLPPAFDGLKAAAREVGSVQIQNAGTIAGQPLQCLACRRWRAAAADAGGLGRAGLARTACACCRWTVSSPAFGARTCGRANCCRRHSCARRGGAGRVPEGGRAEISGDLHRDGGGAGARRTPAGSPRRGSRSGRVRPWRSACRRLRRRLPGRAVADPLPPIRCRTSGAADADLGHSRQRRVSDRGGGAN